MAIFKTRIRWMRRIPLIHATDLLDSDLNLHLDSQGFFKKKWIIVLLLLQPFPV